MEPKFEVRQTATHRMVVEFYRYGTRKIMKIYAIILGFVLAVYVLATLGGGDYYDMIAVCAACMLALYWLPDLLTWSLLRQRKQKNGGQQPLTIIQIGEAIEEVEGSKKVSFGYDQIEKIVHLKHIYVLMMDKRTGLVVDPNGFTKGTFAEFKQHLREKCPNLVIPE